jgi:hypothetical protein
MHTSLLKHLKIQVVFVHLCFLSINLHTDDVPFGIMLGLEYTIYHQLPMVVKICEGGCITMVI